MSLSKRMNSSKVAKSKQKNRSLSKKSTKNTYKGKQGLKLKNGSVNTSKRKNSNLSSAKSFKEMCGGTPMSKKSKKLKNVKPIHIFENNSKMHLNPYKPNLG